MYVHMKIEQSELFTQIYLFYITLWLVNLINDLNQSISSDSRTFKLSIEEV